MTDFARTFILDNQSMPPVSLDRFSGGTVRAEVVEGRMGLDTTIRKHIGNIQVDDAEVGLSHKSANSDFMKWITDTFNDGVTDPKRYEIYWLNPDGRCIARRELERCIPRKLTLSELDKNSSSSFELGLVMAPERATFSTTDYSPEPDKSGHEPWKCSQFALFVDELPADTVSKIGSLSWTRAPLEWGEVTIECSNLVMTIDESEIGSWMEWYTSFVLQGTCTDSDEKDGRLEILGPDGKVSINIALRNLGIIRLEPEPDSRNWTVECYVQQAFIEFM